MTTDEKLDAIAAGVQFLVDFVQKQFPGQRILPGNGSPVVPPINPIAPTDNPFLDRYRQSNSGGTTTTVTTPSDPTPSAPAGYEGHDLTPGHPRINIEYAGSYAAYRFNGPGTVYYQVVAGTDSGMRVKSYVVQANGAPVISETEYVIGNKQPFPVSVSGPCIFYVNPEKTGPISVGQE